MLHMFQYMRKDDKIETIIGKWQLIAIKQLYRFKIFYIPCFNVRDTAFGDLYSVVFRGKLHAKKDFTQVVTEADEIGMAGHAGRAATGTADRTTLRQG